MEYPGSGYKLADRAFQGSPGLWWFYMQPLRILGWPRWRMGGDDRRHSVDAASTPGRHGGRTSSLFLPSTFAALARINQNVSA